MNRPISRRRWLLGALTVAALGAAPPGDDPRLAAIRARGRKAEMQGFDESTSSHYIGIGDARKGFRQEALGVSEAVAAEFFKVFTDKGFQLTWPDEKLIAVTLMGPRSYAAFEGEVVGDTVGGHFDLGENRLVMFDFRGPGANPIDPLSEVANTFVLVHETMHQLTFNTGLLDRKADVPKAISEGLATYGETWRPNRKHKIGEKNNQRLTGLGQAARPGGSWIPLPRLIAEDKLFDEKETEQVAYSEAWLLINKLMRDQARLPQFRDYLAALRARPDPARRVELAKTHLGDLDKLDREIRSGR